MALFSRKHLAMWATARQLRKAGLFANDGLILGRAHGRLLRHNGREHVFVVASTQSGKSSCFVLPNLLGGWRESVIVSDPKGELLTASAEVRGKFSRVVHLSPTSSVGQRYNVLDAIPKGEDGEVRAVQLITDALIDPAGKGADKRGGSDEHFTAMAGEALNGLILYGLYTQRARSLGALHALLTSMPFADLLQELERYPHAAMNKAAWAVQQAGDRGERSGIITTLSRTLHLYSDPLIQRATDRSDFTLRDLRERARPLSLYLEVPFADQGRLRGWTRLVLRQLLDHAVSKKEGWQQRLVLMLDEFPSFHRISLVSEGLNHAAGYGVRFALITPSMHELVDTYGVHHHFLEGCKIKMVFGIHDTKIAELFTGGMGVREVTKTRTMGKGGTSREQVKEPLMSATELMGLGPQKALVLAGEHKVIVRKVHYQEKRGQYVG